MDGLTSQDCLQCAWTGASLLHPQAPLGIVPAGQLPHSPLWGQDPLPSHLRSPPYLRGASRWWPHCAFRKQSLQITVDCLIMSGVGGKISYDKFCATHDLNILPRLHSGTEWTEGEKPGSLGSRQGHTRLTFTGKGAALRGFYVGPLPTQYDFQKQREAICDSPCWFSTVIISYC